jgi:hypothetical protein
VDTAVAAGDRSSLDPLHTLAAEAGHTDWTAAGIGPGRRRHGSGQTVAAAAAEEALHTAEAAEEARHKTLVECHRILAVAVEEAGSSAFHTPAAAAVEEHCSTTHRWAAAELPMDRLSSEEDPQHIPERAAAAEAETVLELPRTDFLLPNTHCHRTDSEHRLVDTQRQLLMEASDPVQMN